MDATEETAISRTTKDNHSTYSRATCRCKTLTSGIYALPPPVCGKHSQCQLYLSIAVIVKFDSTTQSAVINSLFHEFLYFKNIIPDGTPFQPIVQASASSENSNVNHKHANIPILRPRKGGSHQLVVVVIVVGSSS